MRCHILATMPLLLLGACGGSSSSPTVPPTTSTPDLVLTTPAIPSGGGRATDTGSEGEVKIIGCNATDAVVGAERLNIARAASTRIVAIGSSSTYGEFATPATSYPGVLQSLLNTRADLGSYEVLNKGVSGDNIFMTSNRVDSDVISNNPGIVILQAGTNDAYNDNTSIRLNEYKSVLRQIVRKIGQSSKVILVNGQYYPDEKASNAGYQQAMLAVGQEEGVAVFDRYSMMRSWFLSGKYSAVDVLGPDKFHPNERTYRCMAQVIFTLITARTR